MVSQSLCRMLAITFLTLSVSGVSLSPAVWAASGLMQDQLKLTISDRQRQIEILRAEQQALQGRIHAAETEMQGLESVVEPGAEFEAKNLAIGIKYDIRLLRERLKQLQLDIKGLQEANMQDQKRLYEMQLGSADEGRDSLHDKLAIINEAGNLQPPSAEELESIRLRQKRLIEQSYQMLPGAAAFNLAKARALEPASAKPVLGEQAVLLSEISAANPKKFIGIMQHLGGNQYYLEAILRPGKQDFVIGGYRFSKVVPEEYAGVTCLILLDVQNREKPAFQYFVK